HAHTICTLSLHDALPIPTSAPASPPSLAFHLRASHARAAPPPRSASALPPAPLPASPAAPPHLRCAPAPRSHRQLLLHRGRGRPDRKSTRLNSSHVKISY